MTKTPEETLHDALLSFAQGVNNDMDEIVAALCKDKKTELAGDLVELRNAWVAASQSFLESLSKEA